MDFKRSIVAAGLLATEASAYTNDTMNEGFKELYYGNPIYGAIGEYTAILGDWFYVMVVMGAYAGLYLSQKKLHLPTMWLTAVLIAYHTSLISFNSYLYYLLVVAWVGGVLMYLGSPKVE